MRYLITLACYGTHLHGDDQGNVDRKGHNQADAPALPGNLALRYGERLSMSEEPYVLDAHCRLILLEAIRGVCWFRGWTLLAAHVRSSHVHAVVEAEAKPEKVMNDFKSYASRALNRSGEAERKRWARHGSARWLFGDQDVRDAIRYVVEFQGVPMAVFNAGLM